MARKINQQSLSAMFNAMKEAGASGVVRLHDGSVRYFYKGDLLPFPTSDDLGDMASVGALVRSIRKVSGLTQIDFSKAHGIPLGTLRRWEQEQNSPDALGLISLILNLPR